MNWLSIDWNHYQLVYFKIIMAVYFSKIIYTAKPFHNGTKNFSFKSSNDVLTFWGLLALHRHLEDSNNIIIAVTSTHFERVCSNNKWPSLI